MAGLPRAGAPQYIASLLPAIPRSLLRDDVYQAIRHLNAQLLSAEPALAEQLAHRVQQQARELASNQLADSREYFYGLHNRSRLQTLAEALRNAAAE